MIVVFDLACVSVVLRRLWAAHAATDSIHFFLFLFLHVFLHSFFVNSKVNCFFFLSREKLCTL
jgi:hypothetical protein